MASWLQTAREIGNGIWLEDHEVGQLVTTAHKILMDSPHTHIYSLGQNAAWIVRAMEKEITVRELPNAAGYIPFSEYFMDVYDHSFPEYMCIVTEEHYPNYNQVEWYRNFLKSIELDPHTVVQRFEKNQRRTVLLDLYIGPYPSIAQAASLLHILLRWAGENGLRNRFERAVSVLLLSPGITPQHGHLRFPQLAEIPLLMRPPASSPQDESGLALSGTNGRLHRCPGRARFIPDCPPEKWNPSFSFHAGWRSILNRTDEQLDSAVRSRASSGVVNVDFRMKAKL